MVLLAVACTTIAAILWTTSFNVAAPAVMRRFAVGQDTVQWAITGYMPP